MALTVTATGLRFSTSRAACDIPDSVSRVALIISTGLIVRQCSHRIVVLLRAIPFGE